jgi:hypothetical protein
LQKLTKFLIVVKPYFQLLFILPMKFKFNLTAASCSMAALCISLLISSCGTNFITGAKHGHLRKVKAGVPAHDVVKKQEAVKPAEIASLSLNASTETEINAGDIVPPDSYIAYPNTATAKEEDKAPELETKKTAPEIAADKTKSAGAGAKAEGATDGLAIAGFVCSLAGLFVAGILLGTLGIVFSAIALSRMGSTGKKGRGLAIAGIVIGAVAIIGALIVISAM